MKRFLVLLFALLFAVLAMTACGDSTDPAVAETTAPPETEVPPSDMEIIKDGTANYTIIRPEKTDDATIDAATELMNKLRQYTGVTLRLSTDWIKPGDEDNADTLEILVGRTGYSESIEALQGIAYGDYIVTRIGNKLVVNAWTAEGLERAVTKLGNLAKDGSSDGNLTLPADTHITGTIISGLNELPTYTDGSFNTVVTLNNKNYLMLFEDTSADAFAAYLKAMEQNGYTLYAENEINKNKFVTYTNDKYIFNLGYYSFNSQARLIVEPKSAMPPREEDNTYTAVTDPKFAMLGLAYSVNGEVLGNGQCLIWQLSDGSFIIHDGGFNRDRDAKQIYEFLYENAPDKKNIVITAWIISHSHGDHDGCFYNFSRNYAHLVKLKYFISNLPLEGMSTDTATSMQRTLNAVRDFSGAKLIQAHVGQVYHFADARIEILYTLDSFVPGSLNYFNTTSLSLHLDLGGQRFLVLGDTSNEAAGVLYSTCGDYLKSDFVQIAHHGGPTGPTETSSFKNLTNVYTASAAPVALWPAIARAINSYGTLPRNTTWMNLPSTKEIFMAGDRQVVFTLPYTYGTSGLESILK